MKPNQLQAFAAVCAHASIRGAARALGVTPPAVTKIIRELERDVGAPLVARSVKGIELTAYGAALAPRAQHLLDDIRRAREEIAQLRDGAAGHLRVAVSTAFAQTALVPAFKELRARRPGVSVHFSESGLPGMLARLRDARIDFAITHVDPQALGDEFDSTALFPIQLVVGARTRHPMRHARALRELMDQEWVLPGDGLDPWSASTRLFGSLGLPVPARVMQGDSISAALALVAQMNCLGLFVEPLATRVFKSMGIRQLMLEDALPRMQVCAIQRKQARLTPAALQFIDCVRLSAGGAS